LSKKKVVITGLGVLAPNGNNIHEFWESLCQGKSGINAITYFDTEGNVKEGYSRWYMIQEWFKGTAKGLLKGKVDGFADHGMGNYHGLCEKESKK